MVGSRWSVAFGAVTLFGLGACGGSESPGASPERVCGMKGEVVAALWPPSSDPAPELEPLRDCERFRGSLHLHPTDSGSIAALASLRHIEGSLLLRYPGDVRSLSALRTIGGRLILHGSDTSLVGLGALERVGGLWLYDGDFTDLSWLPNLHDIAESMVARRNSKILPLALQEFAAARVRSGARVSLTDSVPPEEPDPGAVLCGEPNTVTYRIGQFAGARCTRILGSLHLSDVFGPDELEPLSTVVEIDGSLSVFRNHTGDFSPLGNLRRVGARFSLNLVDDEGLQGFESLRELGELTVFNSTFMTSFEWLPALTKVRESAVVNFSEPMPAEEVTALLSRIEVGGETVVQFMP